MSLKITEVVYGNPACETQRKDFPYSAEYPRHGLQNLDISLVSDSALIGAEEIELLW
jgi:hypothetical protein